MDSATVVRAGRDLRILSRASNAEDTIQSTGSRRDVDQDPRKAGPINGTNIPCFVTQTLMFQSFMFEQDQEQDTACSSNMASNQTPVPYARALPGDAPPRPISPHFSTVAKKIVYMKTFSRPSIFVQTEFGSKETQQELKTAYMKGTKRNLTVFVDAHDIDTEWVSTWESYASAYVNSTVRKVKGGKTRPSALALQSMVSYDNYDKPRLKMTMDPDVLDDLAQSCGLAEDNVFDMPNGIYGIIFTISGIWKNGSAYGISMRVLKMKLKKETEPAAKRLKPSDYIMPESDDEEVDNGSGKIMCGDDFLKEEAEDDDEDDVQDSLN